MKALLHHMSNPPKVVPLIARLQEKDTTAEAQGNL